MLFFGLITRSCDFRVHRAGSQLKMSNDKSWNPLCLWLCLCQMSNAYFDPWDMLNNICFNVYAQVTCQMSSVKCLCWSLGHDLDRRKYRVCPVPSQVQGIPVPSQVQGMPCAVASAGHPCAVASAGHALCRCKFRDTVVLIKLRPGGLPKRRNSQCQPWSGYLGMW